MSLVLAHAGHWLEGIAFGLPVVATPGVLVGYVLVQRRRERLEARS